MECVRFATSEVIGVAENCLLFSPGSLEGHSVESYRGAGIAICHYENMGRVISNQVDSDPRCLGGPEEWRHRNENY